MYDVIKVIKKIFYQKISKYVNVEGSATDFSRRENFLSPSNARLLTLMCRPGAMPLAPPYFRPCPPPQIFLEIFFRSNRT